MGTILNTIADYARLRVAKDKEKMPLNEVKRICSEMGQAEGAPRLHKKAWNQLYLRD